MIKNNQWKSVKIKWGKEKGSDTWDFALVKANGEGAQKFCENKEFKTTVSEDWVTVYKNLGWNVNSKDSKNKEICIWKISSEGATCGIAMSCFWKGLDN